MEITLKPVITTLVIDRPIEEVYDVATCQRRCVSWHSSMVNSTKVTNGEVGVGTEYDQTSRFLGFSAPTRTKITRWEPPYHFAAHSVGPASTYVLEMDFREVGGGTEVTCTVTNSGPKVLLARFSEALITKMLERTNERDFQTLKLLLESESPINVEEIYVTS